MGGIFFFLTLILLSVYVYLGMIILMERRGLLLFAAVTNGTIFHYVPYVLHNYVGEDSLYQLYYSISSADESLALMVAVGTSVTMVPGFILGRAVTKPVVPPRMYPPEQIRRSFLGDSYADWFFHLLWFGVTGVSAIFWIGAVSIMGSYYAPAYSGHLPYGASIFLDHFAPSLVLYSVYRVAAWFAERKQAYALVFIVFYMLAGSVLFTQRQFGIGIGAAVCLVLLLRRRLTIKTGAVIGVVGIAAVFLIALIRTGIIEGAVFIPDDPSVVSMEKRVGRIRGLTAIDRDKASNTFYGQMASRFDSNTYLLNIDAAGPAQGYYLWYPVTRVILLTMIPRFLWPEKLDDLAATNVQGEILNQFPAIPIKDYIPSIPSELWAMGGEVGVLIGGLVIGFLLAWAENWGSVRENLPRDLLLLVFFFGFISADTSLTQIIVPMRIVIVLAMAYRIFMKICADRTIRRQGLPLTVPGPRMIAPPVQGEKSLSIEISRGRS